MLIFSDPKEPFRVYCDTSNMGFGGVLMQNRQVVAYVSRELQVHGRNYPTYDLKLAAVVFMLKLLRHYFYGSLFEVFRNHKRLKYLLIRIR